MTWHVMIATLTGKSAAALLPVATSSRVHLSGPADEFGADGEPDEGVTWGEIMRRTGISHQAARYRLRQAEQSGDYSKLFAPSRREARRGKPTSADATAPAAPPVPTRKRGASQSTKSADVLSVRRSHQRRTHEP